MPFDRPSEAAQWRDILQAQDHAEQWFVRWQKQGQLWQETLEAIRLEYAARRQKWELARDNHEPPPTSNSLPVALQGESVPSQTLRYWVFLENEIGRLGENRVLRLSETHLMRREARERQAALAAQLGPQDIPAVVPVAAPVSADDEEVALTVFPAYRPRRRINDEPARYEAPTAAPPRPRRSMGEILLDPRNAQWLLAFGGALIVIGLVILLYVYDYFSTTTIAIGLGIINAAILCAGWYVLRSTRFQVAGQGLTLLACLVMPLNLWYYHANNLMTVDGHLWIPALVITALYAISAWVLRSELFVFVFVGGVTMTGLLIIADLPPSPQRFWEIASPATLLIALGLACIHAERVFPDQQGPFSRKRFGLAFFFSGHALLAVGLILVFAAQLAGHWLYKPIFRHLYESLGAQPSPIVGELRWLALILVAAGTYAYVYSDFVVRKLGVYVYIAAFTLCWLMVLVLEYFHLHIGLDVAILVLALAGLIFNVLHNTALKDNPVARSLPYLGVLLPLVAIVLGLVGYLTAISPDLKSVWAIQDPNWIYILAMAVTAVSCRVGAYFYRHSHISLAVIYYFAAAGATMIGATALLAMVGLKTWQQHAPLIALLPIAYLVAARIYRGRSAEQPMLWVANAAMGVLLFSSIATAFDGFTRFVKEQPINLTLALFFAEAALFFGLAAGLVRQVGAVHCCTAMICGVVWQLLVYLGVDTLYFTLVFAGLGVILLVSYRFAILEGFTKGRFAEEAFHSANTLLVISFAVTFLIGLNRLTLQQRDWHFIGLCAGMTVMGIAATGLVHEANWRRAYVILTLAQTALTFVALTVLSNLSFGQKIEIVCVALGLVLLVASHIGWYREQERQSDLVTLGLLLGSLLVGLPLAWATLVDRALRERIIWANELGFLAAGVLLLVSGILCQLRATTLTGAVLTVLYFLTLLLYVPWDRLDSLAWIILVAGALVFGAGLALSVFRERLLTLPARIRQRQGMWRVLRWR